MAQQHEVTVRGNRTSYLQWGRTDGPLALLLHGFPDSPRSWDAVARGLAEDGYRVVAPWLRGYAPTAVPADGRYQGGAFVADALSLRDALGGSSDDVLVGHDIGAAIAYGAAALDPGGWRRVVTLSLPPLAVLGQLLTTYPQIRRSWYTFFFQHPAAETLVALEGLAFLEQLWREWSPGLDPSPYLPAVREALPEPANLTAALGWYRSGFHPEDDDPELAKEQQAMLLPTPQPWLYLHGSDDQCIGVVAADLVPDAVVVPGAGHFPHLEQPERTTALLREFLLPVVTEQS